MREAAEFRVDKPFIAEPRNTPVVVPIVEPTPQPVDIPPPATPAPGALAQATEQTEDLTEAEQRKLKEAVLTHLNDVCVAEDREVLAEFVAVLAAERKTRAELVAELSAVFLDGTEDQVDWVEECRADIVRRRQQPPRNALRAPPPEKSVSATSSDSLAGAALVKSGAEAAAAAPPGGQATSVEAAAAENPLIVVTDRLVLQPNPQFAGAARAGEVAAAVGPLATTTPAERRTQLLAEMTGRLQDILARLSDTERALDEGSRERYQLMAESIQAKMAQLSSKR